MCTLIVVNIVAQRVFEVDVECEVLPSEVGVDVTVDVGVGIADDGLVIFCR
jgi:hypothetical protein